MAQFLTKYTTQVIPSESSIRSQVPTLFNKMMDNIRVALKDQFLWVAIDETTDHNRKCVVNIIVGVLSQDKEDAKKKFLIKTENCDVVNNSVIVRLFQRAMIDLDKDFDFDRVLLLLSDAAPYMVCAGKFLRERPKCAT